MVPLDFRAKGSVVFSVCEPSNDQVGKHLSECGRNKPLTIPHNATIESFYGEQVPPIKVTWNSNSNSELSPVATVVASSSGRKSRRSSSNVSVKSGTEDGLLCFDEDKEYTTDVSRFVPSFFTISIDSTPAQPFFSFSRRSVRVPARGSSSTDQQISLLVTTPTFPITF